VSGAVPVFVSVIEYVTVSAHGRRQRVGQVGIDKRSGAPESETFLSMSGRTSAT